MSTASSARQALVFWREMHRLGDERAEQYRRPRRRYHDAVRRLVRDGQASGAFATRPRPPTPSRSRSSASSTSCRSGTAPGGRKRPAQLAAELADFVLAGLAVPAHEKDVSR